MPEAVSWVNSWSDNPGGWAFHADDTPGWAFLISPREGEKLRARLQAGETLRAHAVVRTSLGEGTLPAITGVIPGSSSQEEVLMLGHQFEQGAIDNASGVGIMIDAMRSLRKLIEHGKLAPPQRTIRCLFVSECYTTFYWTETSRTARNSGMVASDCMAASVTSGAARRSIVFSDFRPVSCAMPSSPISVLRSDSAASF